MLFCCCINEGSHYAEKSETGFTSELFASLKYYVYFGICYKNDDLFVVKRDTGFLQRGMRDFSTGVCR